MEFKYDVIIVKCKATKSKFKDRGILRAIMGYTGRQLTWKNIDHLLNTKLTMSVKSVYSDTIICYNITPIE
jgi:hypothetical protein